MTEWVKIQNIDALMTGYQKNDRDNTMMPGLGDYLIEIIEQNNQIINLLKQLVIK